MRSIKKELKIFRGTYEEVMAQTTEDMTIYLSWDSQEIFVGNKYGVKTPYIGGQKLTEREIKDLFKSLTDGELSNIRSQILSINILSQENNNDIETLKLEVETLKGENNDEIVADIVAILTGPAGALNNYFTKAQTLSEITSALLNYYTKSQVDNKFPDVPNFKTDYVALKNTVASNQLSDSQFHSIKILSQDILSESQLIQSFLKNSSVQNGLYTFRVSSTLFEILNKTGDGLGYRISHDGKTYRYVEGETNPWVEMDFTQNSVKSVNSVLPSNGALTLSLAQVNETETLKLNNLFPQGNGSINPLGRNSSFAVGVNSISIGNNSAASGTNSISIGSDSVSAGDNSIQLGAAVDSNTEPNSLRVWDWKLLDKTSGLIPNERLEKRFFSEEVTLSRTSWNPSTTEYTVSLNGITQDSIIWITPFESSISEYGRCNVRGISQDTNSISFRADFIPNSDLIVKIVWRN
jgi:hypothetical protein